MSSSESDYDVEQHITAKRVRHTVNDDTADLLGNFDDTKRSEILEGTYKEHNTDTDDEDSNASGDSSDADENANGADENTNINSGGEEKLQENGDEDDVTPTTNGENTELSKEQLTSLLRGTSKTNRHVLYVTNLNFDTSKGDLEDHFGAVGKVKSVRVPKKRRGGFAFVEMVDLESYQHGFKLHNTELHGRRIKVQFSEAGKKKSANKKNIIKQKNRKLAEMRQETKKFTKSGKFYDKSIKKEKAKEMLARKRWRKKPSGPTQS